MEEPNESQKENHDLNDKENSNNIIVADEGNETPEPADEEVPPESTNSKTCDSAISESEKGKDLEESNPCPNEKDNENVDKLEVQTTPEEVPETENAPDDKVVQSSDVSKESEKETVLLDNTEINSVVEEQSSPSNETDVTITETHAETPKDDDAVPHQNESSVEADKQIEKTQEQPQASTEVSEKESTVDSTAGSSDKDSLEKNIEPENTEFVQFSQDRHDDSQIESQGIDAEDPFGGDNMNSENIEQMEVEDLGDTNAGFSKLCDQVDNLQNAINATESSFRDNSEINLKDTQEISKDTDTPPSQADSTDQEVPTNNDISVSNEKHTENLESASESSAAAVETTNKNSTESKVNEVTPMETEEEQANVLPGQDDELCIIPDSMKLIIPGKPVDNSTASSNSSEIIVKENESSECTKPENADSEVKKTDCSTQSDPPPPVSNAQETKTIVDISETTEDQTITTVPGENTSESTDKNVDIEDITPKEACKQCKEMRSCKIRVHVGQESYNVCSKTCKALFKAANNRAMDIPSDGVNSKREKRCANCLLIIEQNDERNLSWETMEFCNEECLGKFQTKYGSYCRNCNGIVQAVSLGKYCVRFGYDVRQFCCSTCLEEFKKGLKVCSYCQKDISSSSDGFLAPVGDKGQFKDFCTQDCMAKYSKMSCVETTIKEKKCCSVCQEEKIAHCEVQLDRASPIAICSEPCFAAFKFVKKVDPDQCSTCKKFFELPNKKCFVVFYENEAHTFCSKTCLNVFIITNRKIVPCNWCKVKKYNFDMIKKELKTGQVMMMCSLNCLTLYQVSINAVSAKRINCDFCKEYSQAQYHLTMSDATIRNFCSYNCVMKFQAQYTKSPITIPAGDDPVPTSGPKRTIPRTVNQPGQKVNELQNKKNMPVISSVTSLATMGNGQATPTTQQNNINNVMMPPNSMSQNQQPQIIYKQQIITRPPSPVKIHNKVTQCKPLTHTKGVSVRPHPCTKSTQTDGQFQAVIPIPVPIYVPFPVHMYSMPFPVPVPFPLPIPVPIFIPTTRNSAKGIFKDIKRIQEKIPADPFEAELLMMAEMVATEKKANESDSDSADDRDEDAGERENSHSSGFSPEGVDSSNTFGDDMLQMALKMATGELDEPPVDLEAALTPNTITASQTPTTTDTTMETDVQSDRLIMSSGGRKRMVPYKRRATPSKRGKRASGSTDVPLMPPPEPQPPPQPRIIEPIEKPDANMALKYTFGVNAWRQWVATKNTELEKQNNPMRKLKLFKTDLLQLTADELNYSLCLFVKEVRKPNGAEYAPDTIYYLCLGIQQYLFENNRIDNIFTDSYYEKFTDCLNEVAKKFSVLYNDAQYIVTRVEEEHLWECKQLGAHSPHVLLSTLMFFNTKHFNLVTVEEHMQLSFSHIMKHWKRNPAAQPAVPGKVPGSRNVLLRFYPPQAALEGNSRKKKVYEQQENEENPLRCPVKLYEFYLSKCPESVKTRNDVFYLLPERSCVPDSPVWYSTSALAKEQLVKMLYRIKMVKEINVSMLTS